MRLRRLCFAILVLRLFLSEPMGKIWLEDWGVEKATGKTDQRNLILARNRFLSIFQRQSRRIQPG
jgi:hypothetical protein